MSSTPRAAFADHGAGGEPLAILLRPGNAGSNTAAGHMEMTLWRWLGCPEHCGRMLLMAYLAVINALIQQEAGIKNRGVLRSRQRV